MPQDTSGIKDALSGRKREPAGSVSRCNTSSLAEEASLQDQEPATPPSHGLGNLLRSRLLNAQPAPGKSKQMPPSVSGSESPSGGSLAKVCGNCASPLTADNGFCWNCGVYQDQIPERPNVYLPSSTPKPVVMPVEPVFVPPAVVENKVEQIEEVCTPRETFVRPPSINEFADFAEEPKERKQSGRYRRIAVVAFLIAAGVLGWVMRYRILDEMKREGIAITSIQTPGESAHAATLTQRQRSTNQVVPIAARRTGTAGVGRKARVPSGETQPSKTPAIGEEADSANVPEEAPGHFQVSVNGSESASKANTGNAIRIAPEQPSSMVVRIAQPATGLSVQSTTAATR